MTKEPVDRAIARLAARQHGVFSRAQAVSVGATKAAIQTRIRTGRWERVHPGVLRLAGTPATWRQSLIAAALTFAPRAAVSHRAAAALWGIADAPTSPPEVSVEGEARRPPGIIVHRVGSLPAVDRTVVDAIPVTTVSRTLIDLASVEPLEVVEEALDEALRRDLVTIKRIMWRIEQLAKRGRPGIEAMRALVEARDPRTPGPDSRFERRFLRVLTSAGLPPPAMQHRVRLGRSFAAIDFAYPDLLVAIETDGYRAHSGRARWEHDRARANALTAAGWVIVRVTWRDLTDRPRQTMERIAQVLARAARKAHG